VNNHGQGLFVTNNATGAIAGQTITGNLLNGVVVVNSSV